MKILFGVDRLVYGSGVARVTEEMARYIFEKGDDVKIVCGKCDMETIVPVILCKFNNALYQSHISDVRRIIKQEKPDIFHTHYYPMDLCGALMNSPKIKHVMHYHGVSYANWRLGIKRFYTIFRAESSAFFGAHFSEKVLPVSKYMGNVLKKKYRINDKKIEVVYNSVDLNKFNPSIMAYGIRNRHDINSDDFVILCVAGIAPGKRQDLLIDCMKIVVKKIHNIKLLFVGMAAKSAQQYVDTLNNKILKAKLDKNIIFCGRVSEEELPKYYAACDAFVSTTQWEGFGLPFIEAMACEKPVIGFDLTAISELINNGYNGYKVNYPNINEMAERIIQLANNPDERKKFGSNGRKYIMENFNAKKNLDKVIKIYSQLSHDNR